MASGAQAAKMMRMMLAMLFITMADSHSQPEGTCSAAGCACAEKCVREHPIVDIDPPFKISPVCTHRAEHELYAHLYLHHTSGGQYTNQQRVLSTKFKDEFGSMSVNDWVITDGRSRDTKVVAHAKGFHIRAGLDDYQNYYVSFNMVFVDGRFKGSTLQVMGTVVHKGEWAIVGGTGEFMLARGVIYKPYAKYLHNVGDVIEIDIHCLYTPMERSKGTSWTFEA
ncbi:unnamed protein product [Alopecurus aequalis]